MMWRILLFGMGGAMMLHLDAYAYTVGMINIRPWMYFAVMLVLITARGMLTGKDRRDFVGFACDESVLIAGLAVYVTCQLVGLIGWLNASVRPDEVRFYVFWVYMVALLFFGAAIGKELGEARGAFFFWLLAVHTGVVVFDAITHLVSQSAVGGRPAGTMLNPNGAAFVADVLMVCAIRWRRMALGFREIVVIAMATVTVLMSESRGGLLVLYAGYVSVSFWFVVSGHSRQEGLARIFASGVAFMLVALVLTVVLYAGRFGWGAHVGSGMILNYSGEERVKAAREAFTLIREHPLLGHGTGYVYTQVLGPHNMFLRAWVEGGVIGVFGFLCLLGGLFLLAKNRGDWGMGTLAAMICLMAMTSHNVTEDRSLWIAVGVMVAHAGSAHRRLPYVNREKVPHRLGDAGAWSRRG